MRKRSYYTEAPVIVITNDDGWCSNCGTEIKNDRAYCTECRGQIKHS